MLDFSSLFEQNVLPAIIGGGLTLAGAGLWRVFNQASGLTDIAQNTEAIMRSSQSYAELQGLNVEDTRKNPITWTDNLAGILIVDSDKAYITVRKNGAQASSSFDLSVDERLIQFEHAKENITDLNTIYETSKQMPVLKEDKSGAAACAKKARKTWTTPSALQQLVSSFSDKNAGDKRAEKISNAMMFTAKVLAASSEKDVNLSGRCHVAIKWTDENDKSYVIVMPTNEKERDLINNALTGKNQPQNAAATGAQLAKSIGSLHI